MSALKDRYVNPLTDFGFKKLFGTEPNKVLLLDFLNEVLPDRQEIIELINYTNEPTVYRLSMKFIYIELPKFRKSEAELETHFDKWLYVFRHLSQLQDRPKALQEKIFQKLFEAAEIARFTPKEREIYEDSLKYYRDMKNVVDTAREEGEYQSRLKMARLMKKAGESFEKIRQYTGLTEEEMEE